MVLRAMRRERWPLEFTQTVHNNSLLERLSQALNGRFPGFAPNSSVSHQNRSKFGPIYQSIAREELRHKSFEAHQSRKARDAKSIHFLCASHRTYLKHNLACISRSQTFLQYNYRFLIIEPDLTIWFIRTPYLGILECNLCCKILSWPAGDDTYTSGGQVMAVLYRGNVL
jgi:hypothetical protein